MSNARMIVQSGCLLLTSAAALLAQSAHRLSLQVSALGAGVYGTAYEGMKTGAGGELQIRYNPGLLSWGAGVQYTQHEVTDPNLPGQTVDLDGAFLEPRYVIDVKSDRFAPYLSVRLAALEQRLSVETADFGTVTGSANGAQINIGGGILVNFTPRVNLDVGATYGYIDFGDYTITAARTGQSFTGSTGSGQNLVMRIGLAIGLGK